MFPRTYRPRRLSVKLLAFLTSLTLGATLLFVNAASAADFGATLTAPTCGRDVQIKLTNTRSSTVRFQILRSDRTVPMQEVYVASNRPVTITVMATTTAKTFSVKADNKTITSKLIGPSSKTCPTGTPVLASVKSGISAAVNAPTCGSAARVTLNNGSSSVAWLEIWRSGRTTPDATVVLGAGQSSAATATLSANNQTVKVIWNKATIAQKTLSPKAPCSSTTSTTKPPTTSSSTTSTTKPPTTSSTSSTSTTSTTTTSTTVKPPTTPTTMLPPCTGADMRSGYGCPVRVANFDAPLHGGDGGWTRYHDLAGYAPRHRDNLRVNNGELQIVGTYNQSTKTIMGAGLIDNHSQMYGRWEVRMRVETGAGWSAAGLLWPKSKNWPTDGEIDLFEIPKSPRQQVLSVVHNGPNNSQRGKWNNIDATKWHTYTLEWLPDRIVMYADGVEILRETSPSLVPSTSPMQMALQMDARRPTDNCAGWYQCPDANTPSEVVMHVDSVKVWKKG